MVTSIGEPASAWSHNLEALVALAAGAAGVVGVTKGEVGLVVVAAVALGCAVGEAAGVRLAAWVSRASTVW
jgi:hypothetical protein